MKQPYGSRLARRFLEARFIFRWIDHPCFSVDKRRTKCWRQTFSAEGSNPTLAGQSAQGQAGVAHGWYRPQDWWSEDCNIVPTHFFSEPVIVVEMAEGWAYNAAKFRSNEPIPYLHDSSLWAGPPRLSWAASEKTPRARTRLCSRRPFSPPALAEGKDSE
jgi:hypothetical protein